MEPLLRPEKVCGYTGDCKPTAKNKCKNCYWACKPCTTKCKCKNCQNPHNPGGPGCPRCCRVQTGDSNSGGIVHSYPTYEDLSDIDSVFGSPESSSDASDTDTDIPRPLNDALYDLEYDEDEFYL